MVPVESTYNANVVWESTFTQGPAGKVNRGAVDSEGHIGLVFMPEDMTRVHRVDGGTGGLLWSRQIEGTAGFGIAVYEASDGPDYILTGGAGNTQERWMARLDGEDGSTIWSQIYPQSGPNWAFDGLRMAIQSTDGYLYAGGFVGGDEAGTIFVVYGGAGNLVKVDPADGELIWSEEVSGSEYVLALAEANGEIYGATAAWDEDLGVAKVGGTGTVLWQEPLSGTDDIIPYDLTTDGQFLYYGGHRGRNGAGDPFDYSCAKVSLEGQLEWVNHYANPRGYSLSHIRNELYGIQANETGIYMFGGTGDESNYSDQLPPFESSDVWNGWVLKVDGEGQILSSDVFCQGGVNTATEYGCLIDGGYVIFNDTDEGGDTEVGVMHVSEPSVNSVSGLGLRGGCQVWSGQKAIRVGASMATACSLHDAMGRKVWSEEVAGQVLISGLKPGVYVFTGQNGEGAIRETVLVH